MSYTEYQIYRIIFAKCNDRRRELTWSVQDMKMTVANNKRREGNHLTTL